VKKDQAAYGKFGKNLVKDIDAKIKTLEGEIPKGETHMEILSKNQL
jgi:hypothetical protein